MRLLGVHVMGENAANVIHIGRMAMLAEAGADLFNRACFIRLSGSYTNTPPTMRCCSARGRVRLED
jgi:hypothetical protein